MAANSVDISFNASFGSRGSGNGEFQYPTGVLITNNSIYVVDKQNHRVQIFDLSGNYQNQFGSKGSGNDQFYYPEDLCTDGTYIYITDSANHRIKQHDLNGVFVSEFGSRGSGNNEFQYPVGICADGAGNLYISDKQNKRVKIHEINGTYLNQIGGFSFPEGLAIFNNLTRLAVCDSGNDIVEIYDLSLTPIFTIENNSFEYVVGVQECNEILIVIDRQGDRFYNYDLTGNLISEYNNNFDFPISIFFDNDKVYLSDSANHRIQIYDYNVSFEDLFSFQRIMNLTKQLYPTGRAWWMKVNGVFDRLHQGLALSESRAYQNALGLLFKILPDNENFTEEEAFRWEQALGLITNTELTLEERKIIIERKIQFPGTVLVRQHYLYLQDELQKVGFNVFVIENRFWNGSEYEVINPTPSIYGELNYGQGTYGGAGITNFTKLANYIDEAKDDSFNFGDETNFRATIFIGGETFGTRANVDASRKDEFRELVLKIKPAQVACFLLIDYV